jgi:hypothetical protein
VLCILCVSDLKSDKVVGMEGDVTRGSELTRSRQSGELARQASGPAYRSSADENLEFKLIRLDFFYIYFVFRIFCRPLEDHLSCFLLRRSIHPSNLNCSFLDHNLCFEMMIFKNLFQVYV